MEGEIHDTQPKDTNANDTHSHYRSAAEGDPQAIIQALLGGSGGSAVSSDSHIHADKAGQSRADGTKNKRHGYPPAKHRYYAKNNTNHHHENSQYPILPTQKG
ncbi:hypothetical protein ES703_48019 [subsurface metagenome]